MRAPELLASGAALAALAAALGLLVRALRRGRSRLPAALRRAEQLAGALGDAVLVSDASGRIVRANDAAVALLGNERLVGTTLRDLGPDLAAAARGLDRGPAPAFVEIASRSGPLRARAWLARVASRPLLDLVVVRAHGAGARPPPLPPVRVAPAADRAAEARVLLAAAAASMRDPLARASRGASLLRLVSPRLAPRAEEALAAIDGALEDAERRLAALSAAGEGGRSRSLDVCAVVRDLVAAFAPPAGVRVRTRLSPAFALGDDRALRAAFREVLRAAASAGVDVDVEVAVAPGGPTIEISSAGPGDGGAALARALLAPHGGRVEEDEAPGRGHVVRVALVAAPAEAAAAAPAAATTHPAV